MKYLFSLLIIATLVSCSASDGDIEKSVKSGLELIDSTIQVSVKDHVVTLSGEVDDESVKNAAESSIREVTGVQSVVNNLKLKPEVPELEISTRPDAEIREYVNSGLAANNIKGVVATVKEGEIILNGQARKTDLPVIMRVASEAKAKNIKNELKLK
jgi:hyperosmotically inducible protein